MRTFFVTVLLFALSSPLRAQSLTGRVLGDRSRWKSTVYLFRLNQFGEVFNVNTRSLADSATIGADGRFRFARLQPSGIYRLNLVPAAQSEPSAIVNDGIHDNYAFVFTEAATAAGQELEFAADSVLLSARFVRASPRTHLFQQAFEYRMPAYRLLGQYARQMEAAGDDTARRAQLRTQGMRAVFRAVNDGDAPLLSFLLKMGDPLVLAAGMEVYAGFEPPDKNPDLTRHARTVLAPSVNPYARSLLRQLDASTSDKAKRAVLAAGYKLLDGSPFRFDTVQARLVLLDFWASWCQPCRNDLRKFVIPLAGQFPAAELRIVGVNLDRDSAKAAFAVRADKNPYPQLFSGAEFESVLAKAFSIKSIPTYVLYDRRSGTFYRGLQAVQLKEKLGELLQRTAPR